MGGTWVLGLVLLAAVWALALALPLASTNLLGVRQEEQGVMELYAADAGVEHALWRAGYEVGFTASLATLVDYTLQTNGRQVDIRVAAAPTPTPAPSPTPDPSQGNRVVISTTVSPSSVTPGQFTTFTYTLLIENVGTSRLHLEQIGSLLPPGFVYVPGSISSTGIQTSQGALVLGEPTVTMVEGRAQHVWDFGTPLPWLESGATARVGLQAAATPLEGTYSSEAWVRVSAEQLGQVSTGEAGAVVAAWPQLDITASSGRVRLLVRAKVQDTDVVIVSWQVE